MKPVSRKMLIGTAVITLGTLVDIFFGLSGNLLQLLIFVSVGYFLGNTGEHMAGAIKERGDKKLSETVLQNAQAVIAQVDQRLTEIDARLSNVDAKSKLLTDNTELTNKALQSIMNLLQATTGGRKGDAQDF